MTCPHGQYSDEIGLCEKEDFTTDAASLLAHERHDRPNVCVEVLPDVLTREQGMLATQICNYCPTGYHSVNEQGTTSASTDTAPPTESPEYGNPYVVRQVCSKCPVGKYTDEEGVQGEEGCKVCEEGKYNDEIGEKVECKKCPKGTFLFVPSVKDDTASAHDQKNKCVVCPAGKFSEIKGRSSKSQCKDCPEGFYIEDGSGGDNWEAGKCHDTDAKTTHHATLHDELKDCKLCPAGYYGTEKGMIGVGIDITDPGCRACPEGRFLSENRLNQYAQDDPTLMHAREGVPADRQEFIPDMLMDCEIW